MEYSYKFRLYPTDAQRDQIGSTEWLEHLEISEK